VHSRGQRVLSARAARRTPELRPLGRRDRCHYSSRWASEHQGVSVRLANLGSGASKTGSALDVTSREEFE